jgi:glycosyltransferase involved in cell wall biosynthesis
MQVAIITPYYKEPTTILRRAHESILAQSLPSNVELVHYMIGDGHANEDVATWAVRHICLPKNYNDNGNTPRGFGAQIAAHDGATHIAFLDADNWYSPEHISLLLSALGSRHQVATSFRTFHDLSGTDIRISEEAEDQLKHVDTSCFLLSAPCFHLNAIWLKMPKILSPMCDQIFFSAIKHHKLPWISTQARTVRFTTLYKAHYMDANLPVPPNAKDPAHDTLFRYLFGIDGIREMSETLGFVPPCYFEA